MKNFDQNWASTWFYPDLIQEGVKVKSFNQIRASTWFYPDLIQEGVKVKSIDQTRVSIRFPPDLIQKGQSEMLWPNPNLDLVSPNLIQKESKWRASTKLEPQLSFPMIKFKRGS